MLGAGGEAAGQPGSSAGHGVRGLPLGAGRPPSTPDGSFHAGVLAARAESPEELTAGLAQLSLVLFLLEGISTSPMGLAGSSRRLVDSDQRPRSLSLGLKSGRQDPG